MDTAGEEATAAYSSESISLAPALVYGALGAVATYVLVMVFLTVELLVMAGGSVPLIDSRSLLFGTLGDFYGSHVGAIGGFAFGVSSVDAVPTLLYYLVPPALLLFCGRRCADASPAVDADYVAALQGASIALGYGSIVVVSLGAFAGVTNLGAVGIDTLRVTFVAGVVYPLVFGGVGGYTTRRGRSFLRRRSRQ